MKRFVILLLTAVLALTMPLSALAAGQIEVTEDISVSDDYDWTRFKGQNVTLNVYNWGEYISNGSDDSVDVVAAFEKLTGIKVNYTTFDSNESLYAKLKSGAANYDVIIPSDYMVAKMISEGMLMPLMAMDAGSSKAVNVVLMGVLAQHMDLSRDVWDRALEETVPPKFLEMNKLAFSLGYDYCA